MLKYAITDRQFRGGDRDNQLNLLVHEATRWAAAGINFIQMREKDLDPGKLAELTRRILAAVREVSSTTRVLVNTRTDVAIATAADGVHLTAAPGELTPSQVREIYGVAGFRKPIISISCHTLEEVQQASRSGVDAILFGPVYGKAVEGVEVVPAVGLKELQIACEAAQGTPVFALGGITPEKAAECLDAGATGIAGIRLFRHPRMT